MGRTLRLAVWILALEAALAVWLLRLPDLTAQPGGQAVQAVTAAQAETSS